MSSHAASPSPALPRARRLALSRPSAAVWTALGVAALLTAVAFAANGGLRLGETTTVEMALLLGSGVAGAGALLATPDRGPWWGIGAAALFLLFAGWTVLSITWAVNPSDAWIESNRTLTYVAVFAAALAFVRVAPRQWEAVLAGIVIAAVAICGWAVLTKVFPGTLSSDELYARLRAPFGYWNATGLIAAMGIPACVWLGARRHGAGPASALAFPALGLLLVAQLLAYSRGTLVALGVGLAFWFAVVPLRLRGAAVLLGAAAGAVPVALWAFAREGLTTDRLPTDLRGPAGHGLGVLVALMLIALLCLGLFVTFREARFPLRPVARRRIGTTLLVVLALVPVVFAGYLATTDRGLFGSISHGWTTLTDPSAATPPNDPSRLTAIGSVRSRYWNEALKTFRDNPWVGVGAEGYATVRPFYRQDTLEVRHAHGYVVQTLADLGLVGLALALAFTAAWIAAAARTIGRRRRLPPELADSAERIGLLTMAAIVVVFGVHSFIDWTWYVPGCMLVALLCAGWVAGRGPLRDRIAEVSPPLRGPRMWLRSPAPPAAAVVCLAAALAVTWAVWQPLRSLRASDAALASLERGDVDAALSEAREAQRRNPLALEPLSVLAAAQARAGDLDGALATLRREVRLQPANPEPWVRLADFQYNRLHRAQDALDSLERAVYLDPRNPETVGAYLVVRRDAEGS
ncbi:MAG TPA: O-antigen ligase family protein [Capillimicrobium sp.]|nr:O-antigen ligase family protein [Capillimicrobium sp.]